MINFSRRQLARYAVDEMLAKRSAKSIAASLAAALVASRRRNEAELLLSDIEIELEERGLLTTAKVTSAYPLPAELKKDLATRLKKLTNTKEVILDERVDKGVLGGITIETAARTKDMTVKNALLALKEIV
ncbi:F0F1 ATP synthase subunit delta [Candidatus Saccharibacteria bacterium]|nr:F0F1 ATP synthase subunit delta [Candidatus Saccharibacteria bacterium]